MSRGVVIELWLHGAWVVGSWLSRDYKYLFAYKNAFFNSVSCCGGMVLRGCCWNSSDARSTSKPIDYKTLHDASNQRLSKESIEFSAHLASGIHEKMDFEFTILMTDDNWYNRCVSHPRGLSSQRRRKLVKWLRWWWQQQRWHQQQQRQQQQRWWWRMRLRVRAPRLVRQALMDVWQTTPIKRDNATPCQGIGSISRHLIDEGSRTGVEKSLIR